MNVDQPQLFTTVENRGSTRCNLTMRELYAIVKERADCIKGDHDSDAVAQQFCVEVEKKMGIFPNIAPITPAT